MEIIRDLHKLIVITKKMVIQNETCIGGKKLFLILSEFWFKGKESNPIWIYQWNLLTFRWDEGCVKSVQVCRLYKSVVKQTYLEMISIEEFVKFEIIKFEERK